MGNCTKAWPAKTIRPILSSWNWSTRFDMIRLDFSRRLGATSSASMELDISRAITVSIPLRVTVSCLEPNCGLANRKQHNVYAVNRSQNLRFGRLVEASGINCDKSSLSPYSFAIDI